MCSTQPANFIELVFLGYANVQHAAYLRTVNCKIEGIMKCSTHIERASDVIIVTSLTFVSVKSSKIYLCG